MAGYASLFLLALCIACGLYCAAELAEEVSMDGVEVAAK